MKITLDALLVMDAIERKGSFSAAADALFRVPSAVTYTIQKLEQGLDTKLFDRSGHRARLTPAGCKLLEDGRHLLRAAGDLECQVRRVATGWETELRVAVADVLPLRALYPLVEQFYQSCQGTQIKLLCEVLGGVWDALIEGRADLIIGASGDRPTSGSYTVEALGKLEFAFVCAPHHPLAVEEEPLSDEARLQHRAVASADSSRHLSPRTVGLFSGQDVLTLPNMAAKRDAQLRGLGVGYMPLYAVEDDLRYGRLVTKKTASGHPAVQLTIAWRNQQKGRALQWFCEQLLREQPFASLLRAD